VLGKVFIAYSNSLGRSLERLGLRPDRADKLPSLEQYLASRTAATAAASTASEPHAVPAVEAEAAPAATEDESTS